MLTKMLRKPVLVGRHSSSSQSERASCKLCRLMELCWPFAHPRIFWPESLGPTGVRSQLPQSMVQRTSSSQEKAKPSGLWRCSSAQRGWRPSH
jgi:hypothetical protein